MTTGDGAHDGFGLWLGAVLDRPAQLVATTDAFWSQALGWAVGKAWRDYPQFHHLEPPKGDSHVLIQTVEGPPRLHLDLYAAEVDEQSARIAGLGAALGQRRAHWQVLTSPAGFEFCVVHDEGGHHRPVPRTWPDGHRSSLAQVCLDVPNGQLDDEAGFWRAVTGWSFEPSASPEFAGHLKPPAGGSMQLLLQELGEHDPVMQTRAHLDLGADDTEAVADQLVALGAERVRAGRGWIVMRDPAGVEFCVTGQAP